MSKKAADNGDNADKDTVDRAEVNRDAVNPFRGIVVIQPPGKSSIPTRKLDAVIREIMNRCEPEKI
jgi:hypothetical protein